MDEKTSLELNSLFYKLATVKSQLKKTFKSTPKNTPKSISYLQFVKRQQLTKRYLHLQQVLNRLNADNTTYMYQLQGKRNKTDLTGDIIDHFLIINKTENRKHWHVQNLITKQFETKAHSTLLSIRKEQRKAHKSLIDQRFGKLIVIKGPEYQRVAQGTHFVEWLCLCDCGNTVWLDQEFLKKQAKDCGPYCKLNLDNRITVHLNAHKKLTEDQVDAILENKARQTRQHRLMERLKWIL